MLEINIKNVSWLFLVIFICIEAKGLQNDSKGNKNTKSGRGFVDKTGKTRWSR
jgi:hypothetical protein